MFDFGVEDYERLAAKKPLWSFCSDDQNNEIWRSLNFVAILVGFCCGCTGRQYGDEGSWASAEVILEAPSFFFPPLCPQSFFRFFFLFFLFFALLSPLFLGSQFGRSSIAKTQCKLAEISRVWEFGKTLQICFINRFVDHFSDLYKNAGQTSPRFFPLSNSQEQ